MPTETRGFIGITEAGDAGHNLSWYETLLSEEKYLGAVLITKSGDKLPFQEKALELIKHKPCIVHFDCTGWGGTQMEPNVAPPERMVDSIRSFIDAGFPARNIVLRIDPIIPTKEGLARAEHVLKLRQQIIPDVKRIRVSIYDDYHKAREEMARRGYEPIDDVTKWKNEQERRPTSEQIKMVADMLLPFEWQVYELCAEPELAEFCPDRFNWCGCISEIDCRIMGIEVPPGMGRNGQNRFGCQCLRFKKELLSSKTRCPNNCAYCYWGRG